ncbi:MAG TPA: 4-hydroxy-3-methylbut-2-enyl diphosphate reductase [Candidatus Omnitrophota bacterium]|nr:4-hydroxy-3-methylbut-2-enyl diphosphate reductase [Candidatus Omnitrophota bacterium]HRZ15864.1 4-hydroxy-3-methylbut-2-enyl diphosphate reductase [Candidatus Omnitrophota bacterium]
MFKVKLARHIGFCAGVRRAIGIVEKTLQDSRAAVYSLGSVIHNPQEVNRLTQLGLRVVHSVDSVPDNAILILPTHGTPKRILERALHKRLKLIDVMCPYVASVHAICKKLFEEGLTVVIIGDRDHPEIKALKDRAPGARIISEESEIRSQAFAGKKIGIISQTTQSKDKFFKMVETILARNPDLSQVHMFNTICLDTANRQKEVKQLAETVDAVLVIGARSSANTKRLVHCGRKSNAKTYLVESPSSCPHAFVKGCGSVGVISGASAPDWLVKDIVMQLRREHKKIHHR